MSVVQPMCIRIYTSTTANIGRSRALACEGASLVVGNPSAVAAIGLDMTHAKTPAQAIDLLKCEAHTFSEVVVFSDQIASFPVGQIYLLSKSKIASVSSFEIVCAMTQSATIYFESGAAYKIFRDGRGQKEFLVALSDLLSAEESKVSSVASLLAGSRIRRNHLLTEINQVRAHLSLVMQEMYLGRIDINEGHIISEQLKEIERCARRELLRYAVH